MMIYAANNDSEIATSDVISCFLDFAFTRLSCSHVSMMTIIRLCLLCFPIVTGLRQVNSTMTIVDCHAQLSICPGKWVGHDFWVNSDEVES